LLKTLRRSHQPNAVTVYLILEFSAALFYSLIFTVDMVYHATVVHLNPLQLVLVGTILETTIFLFEIPTGVVADLKSRRLSIIAGYFLVGLAFVLEGSLPFFWSVALAQVVWGLGYTFTSGATQAWIADEVGQAQAGHAFLRGSQAGRVGTLVAIPLSVALGAISVPLPIILGGLGMVLLASYLVLAMPEHGFSPKPRADRNPLSLLRRTPESTRQVAHRQPVLLSLLGVAFFYGFYSEGFDRLSTAHLLQDFSQPWLESIQPVIWFGALRAAQSVTSLLGTELVCRRLSGRSVSAVAHVLAWNAVGIMVGLASFALTRSLWLGAGMYLVVQTLRSVHWPLYDAWLNQRIDDSQVRATLFSASSQMDAIGQIAGGPPVGLIASSISIRIALATCSLLLSPVLALYSLAARRGNLQETS
jgi:DHA3 family tetracycline resistance protein-like MFS transporter